MYRQDQMTPIMEPSSSPASLINVTHVSPAPIALFVYRRAGHAKLVVEALRKNHLARESDLFVFADGPKDKSAVSSVQSVRRYIRTIDGFRSVTCIERDGNLGLSKSIIAGVTRLCSEYGRVIVVEDDVVTSHDFLNFMNSALDRYADDRRIFSVGGFNFPMRIPEPYLYDAFCSYRFMCWGWGTWKNRWETADWSINNYPEFQRDHKQQKRFNRGGDDLCWLLARHVRGQVESWDTVWAYIHSQHDAFALLPTRSRTYNIGFDGSGVHCRQASFPQMPLSSSEPCEYRFPDSVIADEYFAAEIRRFRHRPFLRRLGRYIYDTFKLRGLIELGASKSNDGNACIQMIGKPE